MQCFANHYQSTWLNPWFTCAASRKTDIPSTFCAVSFACSYLTRHLYIPSLSNLWAQPKPYGLKVCIITVIITYRVLFVPAFISIDADHWDKHVLVDSVIPICRAPILLKKGVHAFPFEILLSNALSESVECGLGHVRYKLMCQVHVKPAWPLFSSYLKTQRSVMLVRLPQDSFPRCISQTHTLGNDEIHVLVETAHITPGTPFALSFSFSRPPASVEQVCVKLIERQKFRARVKRTTRILHHEIVLVPTSEPRLTRPDELHCVFRVPDKQTLQVHPSTCNPNIRVRHWIQILLHFTALDGSPKEILMDAPISVLKDAIENYITLPAYQQASDTTPPSPAVVASSSLAAQARPTSWLTKLNPRRSWLVDSVPPPAYDEAISSPAC